MCCDVALDTFAMTNTADVPTTLNMLGCCNEKKIMN